MKEARSWYATAERCNMSYIDSSYRSLVTDDDDPDGDGPKGNEHKDPEGEPIPAVEL